MAGQVSRNASGKSDESALEITSGSRGARGLEGHHYVRQGRCRVLILLYLEVVMG